MKNRQENLATLTISSRNLTTSTREPTTRAWISADIWRQDGAIWSKNRKLSHTMGPRGSQHFPSDGLRHWLWLLLLHKSLTRKQAKNSDISCEQHSKRANIGQKKLWHNRSYGRSTSFFVLDNVIKERCHCVAQAWVLLAGYLSADIICFEKRELRGTDKVLEQISEHSVTSNGGYCVYYPSNLFRNARSFENWGIFSAGEYSVTWCV